jgi:hypothetical protein
MNMKKHFFEMIIEEFEDGNHLSRSLVITLKRKEKIEFS